MYQLQNRVQLIYRKETIAGTVVGLDSYLMKPFSGKVAHWISYTLLSDLKYPFDRYWFALWGRSEWILWLHTKKADTRNLDLVMEKSGLAQIEVAGERGLSTPIAALAQYKKNSRYFCIERFSGSRVMYFEGYKISRPKLNCTA